MGNGIVTHLLAQMIPDSIQIFSFQNGQGAPFPDPFFIELLVMEGENRLDIFPLPLLWSDTRTTLLCRIRYHMIDNTVPFGFSQWLACHGILGLFIGLGCADAI